ncbi:BlaI/MecI/CopY family transcriptional regulator [Neptunomonas antarctica]|uniref:Predicted transcriptional regulator n=1 Tax=Neptunomonas antarctica TaxID=619304 RepID=A0A1N7PB68_9GAMM|nr:BlaI/MecI/CopY family transcriptional regulator [Neptunomonas antarctica]SIT07790.1 Predicted transcriptional regulator [Neptunomonas antarctica]
MRLGELEKLLLNYLWKEKLADAKQVHSHFEQTRGGSLNTIQSTLDRLYKKGLLSRTKCGYAYSYSPAVERKELLGSLITDITQELAKNDSDAILEAFIDISTQLDEKSLQRLEDLIATRKNNMGKDK